MMVSWRRYVVLGITLAQYGRGQDEPDEDEPDENEPDENEPDENEGGSSIVSVPGQTSVAVPTSIPAATSFVPTTVLVSTTVGITTIAADAGGTLATLTTATGTATSGTGETSLPSGTGAVAENTSNTAAPSAQGDVIDDAGADGAGGSSGGGGLSSGAKAGIGVGITILVLGLIAAWFFGWFKRRKRSRPKKFSRGPMNTDNHQHDSISPAHSLHRYRDDTVEGHYVPYRKPDVSEVDAAVPMSAHDGVRSVSEADGAVPVYAHYGEHGSASPPELAGFSRVPTKRFELPGGEQATYELEGEQHDMARPQQNNVRSPVSPMTNTSVSPQQNS